MSDILTERWTIDDLIEKNKLVNERKSLKDLILEMEDEVLANAGVDLDLCGHTHDGQLFPLNITCSLIWENSYGYLKKGNMHNIVTSGVGLYGPFMRVGTDAEICSIKVSFQ